MNTLNFWNSFEIRAVSMGVNYDEYLLLHKDTKQVHRPVRNQTYTALTAAFNSEMENDTNTKT